MDEIELSDQYYRRVISGHEGTHLANSRRTSGAFAAGELDDKTNQVTDSSEWVEVPQSEGDTSEAVNTSDGSIDTLIACAVTAVGTLAVTYVVTKYVRPWWLCRERPALSRTWRKVTRRNDDAAESSTSREIDEVIGAKVTSADLRIAMERVREKDLSTVQLVDRQTMAEILRLPEA